MNERLGDAIHMFLTFTWGCISLAVLLCHFSCLLYINERLGQAELGLAIWQLSCDDTLANVFFFLGYSILSFFLFFYFEVSSFP